MYVEFDFPNKAPDVYLHNQSLYPVNFDNLIYDITVYKQGVCL